MFQQSYEKYNISVCHPDWLSRFFVPMFDVNASIYRHMAIERICLFQTLEDKERKSTAHRDNLLREQRYLRRRLDLLSTQVDAIHKRRSVSECSTSTVSSSHSSHSESGKRRVQPAVVFVYIYWLADVWSCVPELTLSARARITNSKLRHEAISG